MTHPADALFQQIHPLNPKYASALWRAWLAATPTERVWVEMAAKTYLSKALGEDYRHEPILLPPPPASVATGEYPLGTVTYAGKDTAVTFGLREEDWIQHVAIYGRTGSGKTNLGAVIIAQLLKKKKPFIVFDWKRNYRDLLPTHRDLLVRTAGRDVAPFQFNPWIPPPNTPADVWLKKLVEVLVHAYFAGEGVIDILMRAGHQAYLAAGSYDAAAYPRVPDVVRFVEEIKETPRQAQWKASALRVLRSLDYGPMRRVTNTATNQDAERLLTQPVILEVDALGDTDKTFLSEALLLWIMQSRLRSQEQRERFRHAVIIEEAHHLFLRRPTMPMGEAITDVLLREVREFGESVILLDQHPSLISLPALGNTNSTVCFNLKTDQDVTAAAKALLIPYDQQSVLGKIPVGEAVVRVQGRHPAPFTIRVPRVPINKGSVTDHDVRLHAQRATPTTTSQEGRDTPVLEPPRQLLRDVALNPYSEIGERYHRLSWARKTGRVHVDALLKHDWVCPVFIARMTKRVKLLNLTRAGREELDRLCITHTFPHHLEHQYWTTRIADTARRAGFHVEHEHPINGNVDITATKDDKTVAIEVETGKSDYCANATKCLADERFHRVLLVATTVKVAEQITPALRRRGILTNPRFTLLIARQLDK